jgi:hypothetical protein
MTILWDIFDTLACLLFNAGSVHLPVDAPVKEAGK